MSDATTPSLDPELVPDVLGPPAIYAGDDGAQPARDGGVRRTRWNQWRFPPEQALVDQIYREVYFEGSLRESGLNRFFTLLTLAAMIAAFGLYTDSVLIVVAAMLINPMMTPIMGFTIALVSGRLDRQINSLVMVCAATGVSIAIGWLAGELLPQAATIPTEIVSRTSPKLIDLVIAIVSGVAGAYALVRKDANTALPGVAVAISLVTPLVATGMLLSYGDNGLASGTFQLFLLNLAAIVFSGSIVFICAGFLPIYDFRNLPRRIKLGLLTAVIGVLVVAIPLTPASTNVIREAAEEDTIGTTIVDWLATHEDVESLGYDLRDDRLVVNLTGPAVPEGVQELREQLRPSVSDDITIDVRFFRYEPLIRERGADTTD